MNILKRALLSLLGLFIAILVTLFIMDPVLTTRLLTFDLGPEERVRGIRMTIRKSPAMPGFYMLFLTVLRA